MLFFSILYLPLFSAKTLQRLLSFLFVGALLLEAAPAGAVPARRLLEPLPPAAAGAEHCTVPIRRALGGPGRRPGATVVPVVIRLEVLGASSKFVGASSDYTAARVKGDNVLLRASVTNLSLYDVSNVVIKHMFTSAEDGPMLEGIGGVDGALLNERTQLFILERVASDETATFTFRLFLTGDLREGLSESQIRLEDFEVLEPERRFPPRTPESSMERSRQILERLGIGTTDVACFTGFADPTLSLSARMTQSDGSKGGLQGGIISVQKTANVSEVRPGGMVVYTISVTNRGRETLRDVLIDDRFSSSQLQVLDAGGGEKITSGLQWFMEELAPDERFVARYRAEVLAGLQNGDHISNTTLVTGEQLRDTSTTQRSASVAVSVLSKMPRTGVELWLLSAPLQVLLGSLLAFLLFRLGLAAALWQSGKSE